MKKELPSPDMLRKMLQYEPDTGRLFWIKRPITFFPNPRSAASWNGRFAGKEAFTSITLNGYKNGRIFGTGYLGHRVAWAIHSGSWPVGQIDHINGDRLDNRLNNLRDVPHIVNGKNVKLRSDNTSGFVGVSWDAKKDKWVAQIHVNGKHLFLGYFSVFEAAVSARAIASSKYDFHKNHGVVR